MRRTILSLAVIGLMLIASTGGVWAYSESDSDTLLGLNAGATLPAGNYYDTFIGAEAGRRNTTGYNNTFVGYLAGAFTTTGYNNSFFGREAGQNNTTGNNNTFMGTAAGLYNTASDNTFMGYGAGYVNSTGTYNTFVGVSAGGNNTTGRDNTFVGRAAGRSNTNGNENTFVGTAAGLNNTATDGTIVGYGAGYNNTVGNGNTFMGAYAGHLNTSGGDNVFIGGQAGYSNTGGHENVAVGDLAGYVNTSGSYNTILGESAGFFNTGSGNVFLGASAGHSETGSNKLYIDNCLSGQPCTDPFIYGEFDDRILKLDGALGIGTRPSYAVDVSGGGTAKSQLHFSLSGTDTGGWITSAEPNNFWLSSGAAYDHAAGGWVQKSADGLAVIAGSSASGYRVFTRSGCPVGSVCPMTARMVINYSGQVGFGIGPSYPLHMASGARVTAGGVWTNASSRDYKEDIQELSAAAAMNTLQGLNPVTFKYKAAEEERHVGLIAEDVPDLVATKDRKGMSPMDVVAVLTKVVKEQQDTVSQQQQAIQEQNKVVASQQEAIQHQEQITKEQQQANQELIKKVSALEAQQEANQELIQELAALKAEVKRLGEVGGDGRLARLAN